MRHRNGRGAASAVAELCGGSGGRAMRTRERPVFDIGAQCVASRGSNRDLQRSRDRVSTATACATATCTLSIGHKRKHKRRRSTAQTSPFQIIFRLPIPVSKRKRTRLTLYSLVRSGRRSMVQAVPKATAPSGRRERPPGTRGHHPLRRFDQTGSSGDSADAIGEKSAVASRRMK